MQRAFGWTRGESLRHNPVLVMFEGTLWLEVTNDGLGASTMDFLRTQGQAAWQKPEALPNREEFKQSPAVAQCECLHELAKAHPRGVSRSTRLFRDLSQMSMSYVPTSEANVTT